MIKSFGCKLTEDFFYTGNIRSTEEFDRKKALRVLDRIDNSPDLKTLSSPANKIIKNPDGTYSLGITDNMVACFRFNNGDAYNVSIKGI